MAHRQVLRAAGRPQRWNHLRATRAFATTPRRSAEIQLEIDDMPVKIEAGSSLIQACEKAGVVIPRHASSQSFSDLSDQKQILLSRDFADRKSNVSFAALPATSTCTRPPRTLPLYKHIQKHSLTPKSAGNCRMCLVEVKGAPKPVASCAWPVQPNMKVYSSSPLVHKAREGVMEFLLANHPLDCPICDQGGECDLQDQSMRYGGDRGRFHEMEKKRAVEDKDIGPLVKTSMNRCIHCTRCVRFANDIAGAPELGSTGRGNSLEIGTYLQTALDTELSGNVIDLCPVGALTSKPYAFRARPWELQHAETIDVMDGLGSAVRADSKGIQVMRIVPRLNSDINSEFISDRSRFAIDGLATQRLTTPLVRRGDQFYPATWEQVLVEINEKVQSLKLKENEIKFVAGHLVESESLVAAKDLANKLNSDFVTLDQPNANSPILHGTDVRQNYSMNSLIAGIDEADTVLIIGSNPRWEAAMLNARIRQRYMTSDLEVGLIGEDFASTFEYEKLGSTASDIKGALSGSFGKKLAGAKRPMIIVGSSVAEHPDGKSVFESIGAFVEKNKSTMLTSEWNAFNVLQRAASRAGAYEIGFSVPSPSVASTTPKVVYLVGADEITAADLPKDAFVIYQGHHGDRGAALADIVLPGAAYTEKSGTYVNTEGRVQLGRAATSIYGAAREDWKILRAVSEALGVPLPYDDIEALRDRMAEISPAFRHYDVVEKCSPEIAALGRVQMVEANKGSKATSGLPLKTAIENFYFTDSISRSSPTMARCSAAKEKRDPRTNFMAAGELQPLSPYAGSQGLAASAK